MTLSPTFSVSSPISECDTLADVRSAIDQIDSMLVGLLAERGRYVREAARFKRNQAEVAAPDRVKQVIDKALTHAVETGAEPEVVEAVYRSMVAAFIRMEARQHQFLQTGRAADTGTMSGSVCA